MNSNKIIQLIVGLILMFHGQAQIKQQTIDRVSLMSNCPKPLQIIDFRKLALRFDSVVYDTNIHDKFWPLMWQDSTRKNFSQPIMAMYTAIGDVRQGPQNNKGMFHEALANMGSVLGATLVGIDKSNQRGINYAAMMKNYFNKEAGWNIMMNNTCPEVSLAGGGYGRDWWYDVYPNVLFYAIADKYPYERDFAEISKSIADKFYQADSILNGNYNWSFFNYAKMQPQKNWICSQADAAAGIAWVLYNAYKRFGDKKYLRGAKNALSALQKLKNNPTYEILIAYGPYMAARINAEQNENFDVKKFLHWTFDGTPKCREGWGILAGKWNGYDISGMMGSTVDHGGYGFLMNTYDAAIPLVAMVRYEQSYARDIGKWMLNAANVARLFYPQYMPAGHQTIPQLANVTKGVIAYEGIIKHSGYKQFDSLQAPVAQGDGPQWVEGKNPLESQFSVYGSAHVGVFGSIIQSTNVEGILQLNLLATDFYHDKAYPTFLYYNPYKTSKTIYLQTPSGDKIDLYNTVTGKFIRKNISGKTTVELRPLSAAVFVLVPSQSKISFEDRKMLANGVVIDYHATKNKIHYPGK